MILKDRLEMIRQKHGIKGVANALASPLAKIAQSFGSSGLLNGESFFDRMDYKTAGLMGVQFLSDVLSKFEFPVAPQVVYRGLKQAKMADDETVKEGMAIFGVKTLTASGIQREFEIPLVIRKGEFLEPSVMTIDGAPRIICQAEIDAFLDRATFEDIFDVRGGMYTAPLEPELRDSLLKMREELGRIPHANLGMYYMGNKKAQQYYTGNEEYVIIERADGFAFDYYMGNVSLDEKGRALDEIAHDVSVAERVSSKEVKVYDSSVSADSKFLDAYPRMNVITRYWSSRGSGRWAGRRAKRSKNAQSYPMAVTDEQADQVVNLWQGGTVVSDISDMMDLPYDLIDAVINTYQRMMMDAQKKNAQPEVEYAGYGDSDEVVSLMEQGYSAEEIAAITGKGTGEIYQVLEQYAEQRPGGSGGHVSPKDRIGQAFGRCPMCGREMPYRGACKCGYTRLARKANGLYVDEPEPSSPIVPSLPSADPVRGLMERINPTYDAPPEPLPSGAGYTDEEWESGMEHDGMVRRIAQEVGEEVGDTEIDLPSSPEPVDPEVYIDDRDAYVRELNKLSDEARRLMELYNETGLQEVLERQQEYANAWADLVDAPDAPEAPEPLPEGDPEFVETPELAPEPVEAPELFETSEVVPPPEDAPVTKYEPVEPEILLQLSTDIAELGIAPESLTQDLPEGVEPEWGTGEEARRLQPGDTRVYTDPETGAEIIQELRVRTEEGGNDQFYFSDPIPVETEAPEGGEMWGGMPEPEAPEAVEPPEPFEMPPEWSADVGEGVIETPATIDEPVDIEMLKAPPTEFAPIEEAKPVSLIEDIPGGELTVQETGEVMGPGAEPTYYPPPEVSSVEAPVPSIVDIPEYINEALGEAAPLDSELTVQEMGISPETMGLGKVETPVAPVVEPPVVVAPEPEVVIDVQEPTVKELGEIPTPVSPAVITAPVGEELLTVIELEAPVVPRRPAPPPQVAPETPPVVQEAPVEIAPVAPQVAPVQIPVGVDPLQYIEPGQGYIQTPPQIPAIGAPETPPVVQEVIAPEVTVGPGVSPEVYYGPPIGGDIPPPPAGAPPGAEWGGVEPPPTGEEITPEGSKQSRKIQSVVLLSEVEKLASSGANIADIVFHLIQREATRVEIDGILNQAEEIGVL